MTYHSRFSASAAHRWIVCPGSIPAIESLPEDDRNTTSEAAEEGTALHAVMEHCLINSLKAVDVKSLSYDDHGETKRIEPDAEQHDAVQKVLDHIGTLPGQLFTETRVCYGYAIGVDPKDAFGTADAYTIDGTTVHVYDAKFGRYFVSQDANPQMILYAIGVVDTLEMLGHKITDVYTHIGQPRIGYLPEEGWHMTIADVKNEWIPKFRDWANEVKAATPMPLTGTEKWHEWAERFLQTDDDACRFCPFAKHCPARQKEFDEMIDTEFDSIEEVPAEVLSRHLSMADRVTDYIKQIRSHATSLLLRDVEVEGFKLVKGRAGNRRWASEDKALEALSSAGISEDTLFAKPKLKSPTQVERALKKDMDKEDIEAILGGVVVRNPPKPALVASDAPGDPWISGADLEEFEIQKGK